MLSTVIQAEANDYSPWTGHNVKGVSRAIIAPLPKVRKLNTRQRTVHRTTVERLRQCGELQDTRDAESIGRGAQSRGLSRWLAMVSYYSLLARAVSIVIDSSWPEYVSARTNRNKLNHRRITKLGWLCAHPVKGPINHPCTTIYLLPYLCRVLWLPHRFLRKQLLQISYPNAAELSTGW